MGKVAAMAAANDDLREGIRSLRQLSLTRYYIAFAALFAAVTSLHLWRNFATALPGNYVVDTALVGLKEASSVTPWLIMFT